MSLDRLRRPRFDLACRNPLPPCGCHFKATRKERTPPSLAGLSRKSALAALARLFAGLLRLLSRTLAGLLLTLLSRLVALPALLRLALSCPGSWKSRKLPNYNLNAHHSNMYARCTEKLVLCADILSNRESSSCSVT